MNGQGKARRTWEPSEVGGLTFHVEMKEPGTKVEQMGQRAEVEARARRLQAKTDTRVELGTGMPEAELHDRIEQTDDKMRV